ncbi:hypothetical protein LJR230_004491 [Trinickia sp. LjRoot230]|uniref:hypothetical protein n=1 Tax=Trinickia sp. LjRoot230 TaxID=3342288 RepID=UPI003ECDF996
MTYGEPLLAPSARWTPAQRIRLHSALSRAYSAVKDEAHAGEQALYAIKLDPGNERLVQALRYLVQSRRADQARKLLADAPVSKNAWQEASRINAAAELFAGNEARDELLRARRAGVNVDAFATARALQRAGDAAGAEAAFAAQPQPLKFMTPQNRQLRLDVAFAAGNAAAAADMLHDEYQRTKRAAPLVGAYAHLLNLSPRMLMHGELLPLVAALLLYAAMLAAAPGMLLLPVHYRGLVRLRDGKISVPLFERIGLRHAWWALAAYFCVLFLFTAFCVGSASFSPATNAGQTAGWQRAVATAYLWTLLVSALCLAWIASRLS